MKGPSTMNEDSDQRPTVDEAIAAWQAKGPTSLTVALMAEALYRVRDESGDQTHGRNHQRVPIVCPCGRFRECCEGECERQAGR